MHQLGPVGEAPSHIWHLINLHRADIALLASSLCSIDRPSVALEVASKPLAAARVLQGDESLTPVTPSARQVRQDLVDHKRILNTAVRLSAMIRDAPSSLQRHKHCRYSHQYLGGPIEYTLQPLCFMPWGATHSFALAGCLIGAFLVHDSVGREIYRWGRPGKYVPASCAHACSPTPRRAMRLLQS